MGFDNECILNIQSLPGEYFCPVCRTLIFPNEALQSQCTHLYCKPCLAYIVATTHACPYDGYLVTEADSKPLLESNKSLGETIGKVQVYCLYHRSGCQWQGTLSDCINHCAGCNFGNSPVVCNRCGTQIVHRQVQEHAQTCPGLQPQGQQVENAQQVNALSSTSNQDVTQGSSATTALAATSASYSSAGVVPTVTSTSTAGGTTLSVSAAPSMLVSSGNVVQGQNQALGQGGMQGATAEQWYRQQQLQYQQYYQQYPAGYDPYQQQQYQQQYGQQYQQQSYQQQFPQTHHMQVATQQQVIQGQQQQAQAYVQPQQPPLVPQPNTIPQAQSQGTQPLQPQQQPQQSQPQPQPQPQPQLPTPLSGVPLPQPQLQSHSHPQPQLQTPQLLSHSQFPQAQQVVPAVQQPHQQQVQPQITQQATQVAAHAGQPHYPQLHPYPQQVGQQPVLHAQQLPQPPPLQQLQHHLQNQPRPVPPQPQTQSYNQTQPQFQQPHMQQQPRPLPQAHLQLQPQPQSQPQSQPLPQPPPLPQPHQAQNPSVLGVTGHQSYPQPLQQISQGVPPQRPMNPQQPTGVVLQQTSQTQFPIHQVRPPQTHMPLQTQQYPPMQPHAQATPFPNAASQPLAQHLAHQPGQQMHQPLSVQMHPQQQTLSHFPSGQMPPQSGGFPSQQPSHSQNSLRSQIQPYMQLPSQGRTMAAPNQPLPQQQLQHSPAKPIQSGMNQHSPNNKNHLARQHGSFHQSQLHSGTQGSVIPAPSRSGIDSNQVSVAGSDFKSAVLEKPADSLLDKASQGKQLEIIEPAGGISVGSETSRSSELVISKTDSDSKSLPEGERPTIDVNENSETPKESRDGLMLKHLRGVAGDFQDGGMEDSNARKTIEGVKEDHRTEGKQNAIPKPVVDGITVDSTLDGPNAAQSLLGSNKQMEKPDQASSGTRSQIAAGNATSSIQAAQPIPQGQQLHDVQAHEKAFPPPSGYYEKNNLSQFPPPQTGIAGPRAAGPFLGHERYPTQNIPLGQDIAMVSQRPSGPDGTFAHNMPQAASSSQQERRFQEPFPHPIPVHLPPTVVPGQLRPPGYSENFPYPPVQAPSMAEPFQPPAIKQPYGSFIPPTNAEEINPFPVRSQSHGVPSNAIGSGAAQIDPLARSVIGGPLPRAFDSASGVLSRGSQFGYEDRAGRSGPVNLMEGPGYYDGRQSLGENAPFGQQNVMQPNMMKMNGLPGIGLPAGVMHDSAFSHGVSDDRFRPLTGERFKPLPEEGLRAAPGEKFRPMMDSGLNIPNRRDFEEDLKQFPRPSHLDGDGSHRFNVYGPTSRPLDWGQHFGPDGGPRPFDRASVGSFPPHPSGGRFPPPSSGGLEFGPLEIADRQRGPFFHDDLGGKHEALSERLRPFSEFGRPHIDSLPSRRSPGIPDGSGHFPMEHGLFRKEIDAFDGSQNRLRASEHVGHGLANHIRGGEPYGARNLPSHLRLNDSASHGPPRGGELVGFGGYGRIPIGDSGLSNSYPVPDSVSFHGDLDSFEHLMKRKHGSMGWCRLCKIDCETVEGLEVHSQTKDHQNMAMEIVLNIKKENAKKHKLTSEEADDTNRSRKASFENRGGRH